jgi:putative FmdB family regulatory protein
MPIYEFRCGECRGAFETLCRDSRDLSNGNVACPACGGRKVSRLISQFAVSRQLTPCGSRAGKAPRGCGFDPVAGGCGRCST